MMTLVFVRIQSSTFAASGARRWAGVCRGEDVCECDVPETCGCSHCRKIPPGDP